MKKFLKILPALWLCACALALLFFFPNQEAAPLGAAMMFIGALFCMMDSGF